jgi:hypothetical protein
MFTIIQNVNKLKSFSCRHKIFERDESTLFQICFPTKKLFPDCFIQNLQAACNQYLIVQVDKKNGYEVQ